MNKSGLTFLTLVFLSIHCFGQTRLRKLPITINHPAINVTAPYISLDGNSLVFISDNSDENQLTMFYTTKKDAVNWKEPVMMPRSVNNRLNFLRGFALSPDGKTLYLSSLKSGGLGGFDILVSQLRGTIWSEPVNIGLPINSSGQEACPSLTPDGSTMYFMRCEKMDQKAASDCKIFYSKKSRLGKWEEPVELPEFVNTGNSQTPRILGDSETLIFSSDRLPDNKGGMDLYVTKLENEKWSKPVPLTFANTAKDDQFVSASSLGRYLLKDQPGARTSEIVEMLFPADIKPKATMQVDGKVSGPANPSSPYIAVFNQENQQRVFNGRPEKDGAFTFYLKEGAKYDFSVVPETNDFTFYSMVYDLTADHVPLFDKVDVQIKPIAQGVEFELGVSFRPNSTDLAASSTQELRRLSRMVNGNSTRKFVIDVTLQGYLEDSLKSNPDLTEVRIDTVHISVEKIVPDTVKLDSILAVLNQRELNSQDSLAMQTPDSTALMVENKFKTSMDSLQRIAVMTVLVDSVSIKRTYHNDRTRAQAKTLIDYLINEGASPSSVDYSNKAIPEAIAENRKTTVKIKVVE
ncbi:MAG: hypothetical protein RIA63_12550 [Cyclobacteriaceae bacterium]